MKIRVLSVARKWVQISIERPNNRPLETRVLKTSVPDAKPGMELELYGEVKWTSNGYGSTSEFVVKTEAEYHAEKIERAISAFRKGIEEGYIATRALETLRQLACHDYDEEIRREKKALMVRKALNNFRSGVKQGYINESAVVELYKLGAHDYDDEIEAARNAIRAAKDAERKKKKEEEAAAGIVQLALPAFNGFHGKPTKGELLMHRGVPYEVISSYYHDADGWSIGAGNDEWYSVKARDISDTPTGKLMLAKAAAEKELSRAKSNADNAKKELKTAIQGKRIFIGDGFSLSELKSMGTIIWDTMNLYGYGDMLIRTDNLMMLVVNNGADGDDWGRNNIATGGAGAYGYECPLADCEKQFAEYLAALETLQKAQKNCEELPFVNF